MLLSFGVVDISTSEQAGLCNPVLCWQMLTHMITWMPPELPLAAVKSGCATQDSQIKKNYRQPPIYVLWAFLCGILCGKWGKKKIHRSIGFLLSNNS